MTRPTRLAGLTAVIFALACGKTAEQQPPPTQDVVDYQQFKAPEIGVQLETPPFTIAAGTEVYRCAFVELASDQDLDVVRFESTFLPGSHHMNVFRFNKRQDNFVVGVRSCPGTDPNLHDYVYAAQTAQASAALPDGVGLRIPAHSQFMIEMHYINAGDKPIDGGVKLNFVGVAPGTIKNYAQVIVASQFNIDVPPGQTQTVTGQCVLSRDVRLVGVATHSHRHTQKVEVFAYDGQKSTDLLYSTTDWHAPEYRYFSPPLRVPANTGFTYGCTYTNDSQKDHLYYGGSADDEMCMVVGYWYPAAPGDGPIYCFDL